MTIQRPYNYMSQEQKYYLTSNKYQAVIYRQEETITTESVMDEFMSFVESESEYELTPYELKRLQGLVNEFMGIDIDKVKRGELEMLSKWNKAVNGE